MSDQEFQIATVGICLRKIKEFLEATTDTTKMEEAKIAHEHLELLLILDLIMLQLKDAEEVCVSISNF